MLYALCANHLGRQRKNKTCFEWFGASNARTMTYEVSASAIPPQTAPVLTGVCVKTRGGYGEYRRRRASGRCAHVDHQNGTNNSRYGEAAHRHFGGILAVRPLRP